MICSEGGRFENRRFQSVVNFADFLIGRENHCHTTWRTCIVLHSRTKHSSSVLTGEQCHCGGFPQQPILALAGSSSDSSGCLNLFGF